MEPGIESVELVEEEVVRCMQEIKPFKKDSDYIVIEEYGGGPDESYLKGTKNALRLFALDVLRKTCGLNSESGILGEFDCGSKIRIDYISVLEGKVIPKQKENRLKNRVTDVLVGSTLLLLLFSTIIGLITIFKWIF